MMMVACSIVVLSAASGAVLSTACLRDSSIIEASLPMERAISRIGTTSMTTTSTTRKPSVYPSHQPVVLTPPPEARTSACRDMASSCRRLGGDLADRVGLEEIHDRLGRLGDVVIVLHVTGNFGHQ